MQDVFENYKQQKIDYESYCKSPIWSKLVSNFFKNINVKKHYNFFSDNFSDGISNSRLFDLSTIENRFLKLIF